MEGFSFEKAHGLRSDAVHGLRESESIMQDCLRFRHFLIDLLSLSIVTALTPPGYDEDRSVRSLMAEDYGLRPCSRMSIKFSKGQVSPYLGEWIKGNLCRKSQRGALGHAKSDSVMDIDSTWTIHESQHDFVESVSYEEFRRLRQEEYSLSSRAPLPVVVPWQDRPTSPAWEAAADSG